MLGRLGRLPRSTRLALLLLLLGSTLVLGVALSQAPVGSRAEQRCFDIVSGMRLTGDWIVPRRDGLPWLNKPPLLYWLGTSLARTLGVDALSALRLVSLSAALGTLLLIVRWAEGRGAVRTGVLAAALFAAMAEVVARGREGTVEMTLCLLANACLFLYAEREFHPRARAREGCGALFALCLGAAILTKATSALLVVALPIALSSITRGRGATLFTRRAAGLLGLALALGFSWHVLLSVLVPGAFEVFTNAALLPLGVATEAQAVMRSATHYAPWYAPVGFLVRGAFPVSLLLPLVVWRGWRTRFWRADPELRFHALTVVSLLAAFMLLPQKRPHYLLPSFPSLALLSAHTVRDVLAERGRLARVLRGALAGWLQLLTLIGTLALLFWFGVVLRAPAALLAGVVLAALTVSLLGAHALVARNDVRLALLGLVAWWALLGVHAGSVDVWRERVRDGVLAEAADGGASAGRAVASEAGADAPSLADARRWARLRHEFPSLLAAFEPRTRADDERPRRGLDIGAPSPGAPLAGSDRIGIPVETPP